MSDQPKPTPSGTATSSAGGARADDAMLNEIDAIARDYSQTDYGLPIHDADSRDRMRDAIARSTRLPAILAAVEKALAAWDATELYLSEWEKLEGLSTAMQDLRAILSETKGNS